MHLRLRPVPAHGLCPEARRTHEPRDAAPAHAPSVPSQQPIDAGTSIPFVMQREQARDLAGSTTKERREVVTYNGTATASLVITQDGTTKTCTLPLPHGKPSCS